MIRILRVNIVLIALALPAATAFAAALNTDSLPSSESRITWEVDARIRKAERVFASPHENGRAWVVTAPGIMETRDNGGSWTLLPNTGRDKMGRIEDVCFTRYSVDPIMLASRDNGVFRSLDSGKTWENVGTVASGLKTACVTRVGADHADRGNHIFYAVLGGTSGISKTLDGGKTWFTIADDFYVNELLLDSRDLIIGARPVKDEDTWSIIESRDGGATWTEVVPNMRPTVACANRVIPNSVWFGSLKGKLYNRHRVGRWQTGDWETAGPDDGEWTSVFSTFGARPDVDLVFAYDPHKYGLLCSKDNFKTWWSENTNLFVGKMVKEGACIVPNSTGSVLYGSINGELFVGRVFIPEGPALSECTVTPPVMEWTKGATVKLTAKVAPADTDPKSKIHAVTANLSHVHGPGNFQLFDDGKHGDGAAGDGVYSGTFTVVEDLTKQWNEGKTRQSIPGQNMLTITAIEKKNHAATEMVPFSLYDKPESAIWWDGDTIKRGTKMADARRAASPEHFDDKNGNIFDMDVEAHSGKHCLHIVAFKENWITGWGTEYEPYNMSNMDYLSFWIKTPKNTQRDLKVMLTDAPSGENDASHSSEVWLIKDGFIKRFHDRVPAGPHPHHAFPQKIRLQYRHGRRRRLRRRRSERP